jgi:hypothetical protein
MFAAYNLFFGLAPGIDNSAHLGGLAAGFGLGAVLARSYSEPPEARTRWRNYVAVGAALLLLAGYSYLKQKSVPVAPPATTHIQLPVTPTVAERSERSGGTWCSLCATEKDRSQLISFTCLMARLKRLRED